MFNENGKKLNCLVENIYKNGIMENEEKFEKKYIE